MNVIITGASAGIGESLARTFSQHGHSVLAVARRADRLQALCEDMTEKGDGGIHALKLDITARGAAQILFDEAMRIFGKVHILVNNAGMSPYQGFQEVHPIHLHQILSVNIQALTELCHIFLPHMLGHGEPSHLVNVGSVGGYAPLPYLSVYSGSKHFVRVFTNILHHECRGSNIQVSALHPGGTLSEFPELAGQGLKKMALGSMMTPEQVAEKAYPAIMKGKRVIVPGGMNKLAVLIGKVLPFPWAMRVMEFIYNQAIKKKDPTYPL